VNDPATLREQPVDAVVASGVGAEGGVIRTYDRAVYVVVVIAALLLGSAAGWVCARVFAKRSHPSPERRERDAAAGSPVSVAALVVAALGEGVVVVDRSEDVLLANPAARTLGALVGDRLSSDELRALAWDALDSADVRQRTVELRRGYLGREFVSVGVAAVPIRPSADDRVVAVALLLSDLTESRRLEAVRRDFVANVSHELKTPVGALTLLAEAIEEAADDPEQVAKFAARMQREGHRLGKLVGELIALSRVQGADALPELAPVLVEDVIDEAMDRTHMAATAVGIQLMSTVTPDLQVMGNELQLISAVENLIENAIAYSPDGTKVVLTGRVAEAADGEWVEISVTDQGMGIADADLDRIFERFYRVDPARSRATGGTGLGLSIVKHTVTNHRGTVQVWSSEGSGSTFTLRLPTVAVRLGTTSRTAAGAAELAPAPPADDPPLPSSTPDSPAPPAATDTFAKGTR
jgi:two-component system sensor histidine kinase SenX3